LLRGSGDINSIEIDDVITPDKAKYGRDGLGSVAEFVNLARLAKSETGL
jgi:hypothetical protein